MIEVAALRAENQHQKQKRKQKKQQIRVTTLITVQDGQDSTQRPMVEEQLKDDDENIDPVLRAQPLRSTPKRVPLRCSKCGSSKHTIRVCK